MSGPPTSFSSFPELPELSAGPSKAPSFSSFPDIDLGQLQKTGDKKRSRSPADEPEKDRRRRDRSKDRGEDRKRRERSKDRDSRRHRDRDRSRDRDDDRRRKDRDRSRERERDRDKERHRDRDKDRARDRDYRRDKYDKRDDRNKHSEHSKSSRRRDDDDERRKEKEDRRRRERERAEELVNVERKTAVASVEDEGVPWYETRSTSKPASAPLPAKAFFFDTVGDRDIARWNLTSSESSPRYRRDAGGRVLGLHDGLRIVYSRDRTQKGVEIAKLGRPYIPRYSAKPLEGSASRHLGRILLRPSSDESEPLGDFTLIDRRRIAPAADLPDYRAITREKDESEDELEAALGQVTTLQDSLKERRVEFERHLSENPGDVQEWIKYSTLHLQESPSSVRKTGVDQAAQPTTRANAEVTLSVLERALNAHRANFHSTELHIAFLRAAEAFWPPDKVTQRWKNVISQLSGRTDEREMISLYLGYIDWREGQGLGSSAQSGGIDEVVDVYIEVLDRLRNTSDTKDVETREEDMIYLFLRACLFLKQAGYAERALGAFQALMEVTFFKPDHLRAPAPPFDRQLWFTGVLQEFEDFWDSEVPRIGETGGKGWKKEMHASPEEADIPRSSAPDFSSDTMNPHERWLEAERQAGKAFSLPGRARDLDAPDDDPFHIVLFEDVSPFLFPVQSPMARLQLIFAFFNFLGHPFTPSDVPTASPASTDPRLRWTVAQNEGLRAAFWPPRPSTKRIAWQTVGGEPMEVEAPRAMASPFGCPVKSWMSSRDSLFAGSHWFRDVTALDLAHVDIDLARNVLNLMRPLVPDPSFVLNLFAFEAALSPKTAVKVAKDVLSSDRDNLALWDGYARLERQRGKITAARQVYVTAIQSVMARLQEEHDEDLQLDEAELWASWAEMEWEEGKHERCLEVLVMAAGSQRHMLSSCTEPTYEAQPPSPMSILKSRQHYASTLSQSPSKLFLGSLFTYYTDGVEAVKDSLTGVLNQLPDGHPQGEEVFQLLVKIVHFHAARHSTPASLARDILESAIAKYPNNTEFLSLYLWGEASGRVYGRIQRLVTDLTEEDKGIVAMLWSVWAEAISSARTFWDPRGGGAERVRRALDRSVNTISGKRSAALWTLYIEFETMMGRPTSAKALCYRAIAAVGGCKDIYLLPFSPALRPHFTPRELSAIADSMYERGIRVRVQTDSFWIDEDEEEDSEGEEAGPIAADYEYGMLREREELKPY